MIKSVFEAISKKMQIDFTEITNQLSHNGEKGTAREDVLKQYLRPYIPDKFEFSKGIIIDSHDTQSKQVDIIIHDKITTPYLQSQDSTKVIPIESVYGVIEVKSTLTKEELHKCVENIASVRSLTKNTAVGRYCPTAGFVFAYDSDSTLETVYKNFIKLSESISPDQQINCICILNKGLILPIQKYNLSTISVFPDANTLFAIHENGNNALLFFYLLLFQTINSITVYPPNMMAYANSSGDLDTQLYVPGNYMPENATFRFLNSMISIAEIHKLQDNSRRLLSGKLTESEILECVFSVHIPMIQYSHGSLDKEKINGTFDYFGNIIVSAS